MPIQSTLCSVSSDYQYLLLTEVDYQDSEGIWRYLELFDLCIMLFDTTNPSTFLYCSNIQSQLDKKGVVYVGTKTDLLQTSFHLTGLHEQIQSFCSDYSLLYPELISLQGEDTPSTEKVDELKQRFFEMGVHPYE